MPGTILSTLHVLIHLILTFLMRKLRLIKSNFPKATGLFQSRCGIQAM